jgi:hypothetical protein
VFDNAFDLFYLIEIYSKKRDRRTTVTVRSEGLCSIADTRTYQPSDEKEGCTSYLSFGPFSYCYHHPRG